MGSAYENIHIGGGDTGQPLALARRLQYIRSYIQPGGARFLDCGCGKGDYVFELLNQFGLDAYGIEFDAQKVQRGKQHSAQAHRIAQGDIQAIESESNQWDYVMVNEVLEHVPDEHLALQEIYRILKPGGILFVFSPNRWFPFETHGVFLKRSGRRVPHWFPFIPYIPLNVGQRFLRYPARNYWQTELRRLLSSVGFVILKTGFLWQTFEDISGRQPAGIRLAKPVLRKVADLCASVPFIRRFGVSQSLVCRK